MSRPKPDLRFMKLHVAALLVAVLSATATPVAVAQTFVSQGPGLSIGPSSTAQSNDAPPNGTVGAAIQAVLPHPTDPNTMYVGGTNGGIWVTRNGGASWTPLSDKQRSLSIASLAFDPTDPSRGTLIAGVGLTSNGLTGGGNVTRPRRRTHRRALQQQRWRVVERAGRGCARQQEHRRRGRPRQHAARRRRRAARCGGGRRALPQRQRRRLVRPGERHARPGERPVSSLAGDGANRNVFFAAVSATGIYKSSNGGADWTPVLSLGANRIARVATGPNGSIAVGVYDSSSGNPTSGRLVERSSIRATAARARGRRSPCPHINPGRQASTDFAIAVDPTNPDVVYVAGDRIADVAVHRDGLPHRATGRRHVGRRDPDQRGHHRRLDHACRRAHAGLRRARTIDPGRRRRPLLPHQSQPASGVWRGLNNPSLSLREPYAVAYNSISRRLVMSAQDTGSAYQRRARQLDLPGRRRRRRRRQCRGQRHDLARAGPQRDLHDLAEPGAADAPAGRRQLAPCCDTDLLRHAPGHDRPDRPRPGRLHGRRRGACRRSRCPSRAASR